MQIIESPELDKINLIVVGKNRNSNNLFVKTAYKKDLDSSLEGRGFPSSDPNYKNSSGSPLSAR